MATIAVVIKASAVSHFGRFWGIGGFQNLCLTLRNKFHAKLVLRTLPSFATFIVSQKADKRKTLFLQFSGYGSIIGIDRAGARKTDYQQEVITYV